MIDTQSRYPSIGPSPMFATLRPRAMAKSAWQTYAFHSWHLSDAYISVWSRITSVETLHGTTADASDLNVRVGYLWARVDGELLELSIHPRMPGKHSGHQFQEPDEGCNGDR